MSILEIKLIKNEILDEMYDKMKKIIPKAFEEVKDYKSDVIKNQKLLGKYLIVKLLNCTEDDIYYNKLKKPYIKNSLYFNLSHSKDYLVFVSSKTEVGIDIEYISDNNMSILEYAFNESEIEFILNNKTYLNNKVERFILAWTLKECIFKASGIEDNLEPKDVKVDYSNILMNRGKDNTECIVINNKSRFYNKEYYTYSIKYFDYIISVASIYKYDECKIVSI